MIIPPDSWIPVSEVRQLSADEWLSFREVLRGSGCRIKEVYGHYHTNGHKGIRFNGNDLVWCSPANDDLARLNLVTAGQIRRALISVNVPQPFDMVGDEWVVFTKDALEYEAAMNWALSLGMCWTAEGSVPGCGDRVCGIYSPRGTTEIRNKLRTMKSATQREIVLTFGTRVTSFTVKALPEDLVELNGKKYRKSDLEEALALIKPVTE